MAEPGARYGAPMPRAGHLQVTFDCADPAALGVFWAEVLGYPRPDVDAWHEVLRSQGRAEPELNATFAIEDPEERRPRLFFQRVPEAKVAKNRVTSTLRRQQTNQMSAGTRSTPMSSGLSVWVPGCFARSRRTAPTSWPWPILKGTGSASTELQEPQRGVMSVGRAS